MENMLNKHGQQNKVRSTADREKGFTLIEVVIAVFILTIGLIGTAAAITFALEFSALSRNVTNGKLIIVSTIEEIEGLRNARRLDFQQIENTGNVNNTGSENNFNGFSNGFKPVSLNPGPDGVDGTDDDLITAGPDGVYGTGDDAVDNTNVRPGYSRKITITNLPGSAVIKKVEVRVQYPAAGGKFGEIAGVGYLNDEFRITR
ncbi:MAG: prepilin-type N-terminal cleavage/methylation domain-containing protein [Pyrinomonadaceae bacterium]